MSQHIFVLLFFLSFSARTGLTQTNQPLPSDHTHGASVSEKHLRNTRQLTFGGENAEAYFSHDGKKIIFQKTDKKNNIPCDQIYISDIENFAPKLVSTGKGRTTCAYFMPGDTEIIYSSTHLSADTCPPVPDRKKIGKYVWPIYSSYEIFIGDLKGNIKKQLSQNNFYDAEATVSPKKNQIVFTSNRNGDLELFTMDMDGKNVKQVTHELGYDGGAFFSPDGSKIVFRASRPKTEEEIKTYTELFSQNLVAPTQMELFICNTDGSELKQITSMGGANWAPFFHPTGEKIIFSSNHSYPRGFPFNLFIINTDGTGLEQITTDEEFDAFPMFSPDGKKLIFSSNRNNGGGRETNLFMADWVE